ncbi:hypothetical protein GE061_006256 [Apolygus lucorum]|uniref:N-acyl-aliphatic-L-amino acid amidohydrolase n=1 Tax=Apolygus lucorum TaxID=248454 RepID=A0A8S9WV45_APOLU|nr:hypothetical protein GE061_006256 [Apolygus lucorum]
MPEDTPVAVLQEYIRIRTDHPNPDYRSAVEFLKRQADRIGLPVVVHGTSSKPVVLMTWSGADPSLPSVLFNSHMDVVPVVLENWTYDPFAAHKTEDGKIYGRGSQDMKSQGVQYIESVLKLKKEGFKPTRTIHLLFVPDEEIGGKEGMASFVKSSEFKSLNVGFAIDESAASTMDFFALFFDERSGWALEVTCTGPAGHGSLLPAETAAEKARIVINEFLNFREQERLKIADYPLPELQLGNVTTVNLTMMEGGIQKNVIPDTFKLTFDIRVSVKEDHDAFANWIQSVATKAGEGVKVNFIDREEKRVPTRVDETNPFWTALKSALDKLGIKVLPIACPGCTDARFLRGVGVPSFGFSPMRNTPILLHGNDEYITEKVFLEGIDVIPSLCILGAEWIEVCIGNLIITFISAKLSCTISTGESIRRLKCDMKLSSKWTNYCCTVHPNPDYKGAVKFLKKQAKRINVHFAVYGTDSKPVVVYTWRGKNPQLPSIMLNSHIDVVPVNEASWTFKPFDAVKEHGRIYGRGSQDTKNTAIQYIESLTRLKREKFLPNRTIHITFTPDNEIGGYEGMGQFVKTDVFKKMNVGFAIDESGPGQRESFLVFNDERTHWVVQVVCRGEPGHGSLLQANSAAEKAEIVFHEFYRRREAEAMSLVGKPMPEICQGSMTSINLTQINGGTNDNTIPEEIVMTFDMRISVTEDDASVKKWLDELISKAGTGVSYNMPLKDEKLPATVLDEGNQYWAAMKKCMVSRGFTFATIASPASTDGRFLRAAGVPTVGFSALRHTPVLLHSNNEYIDESVFLEGVTIFQDIIKALSSLT